VFLNSPFPSIVKPFDTVRGEDQVHVERAIAELNEDFAPPYLLLFLFREPETKLQEGSYDLFAVVLLLIHIQINILRGV